jgi:tetratricopeptide (TPR) repeat protein
MDEALAWTDKSIALNKNFTNLNTKARLLELKGNSAESKDIRTAAMKIATEADMNAYGYQLLNQKKTDEAIAVFKSNAEKYPDSWNVYDSLAEAYQVKGDNKKAVENYKIALSKVSDEQNKTRIQNTISQLNK